jgi:hypothetical protein
MSEIEVLAWLLDNSIPVPFFAGRRLGVDAIIGLIPGFGDLASAGVGLFVVYGAPHAWDSRRSWWREC